MAANGNIELNDKNSPAINNNQQQKLHLARAEFPRIVFF